MYETLLSPFDLGGLRLRNRVVMAAMSSKLAVDGFVSPDQIAYYQERAAGGVGLITVEYACVETTLGGAYASQLALDRREHLDGHRRLVNAIKETVAAAALQLHHAGGQTFPSAIEGRQPVAPTTRTFTMFGAPIEPRALEDSEVRNLIQRFADAAGRAVEAGYDAIELHGAHGYLLAEFLSPLMNRRNDDWGGDFDRRLAFPTAVAKAVKAELGAGRPLTYRFSVEEYLEGGLALKDALDIAPRLEACGVDAISVTSGTVENVEYAVDPMSMDQGWRLPLARAVKETVSIPVMCTGPFRKPEFAEQALVGGDVDLIVLGRPLLADPHWVEKAAADGGVAIRHCTSCNWCVGRTRTGCAENPRAGRELDPPIPSVGRGKPAVVVGAGPGGLAASLMLDRAGFDVTLFEARDKVGGGLIASAAPPLKDRLLWYLDYLDGRLAESAVDTRLGTKADLADIIALSPALVVLASGAEPLDLSIEVSGAPRILSAYDLLMEGHDGGNIAWSGAQVVVYGGGETGCETAELLAERGAEVTLVTRSALDKLARSAELLYRRQLIPRLMGNPRISVVADATISAVDEKRLAFSATDGQPGVLAFDYLVIAQGRRAGSPLKSALDDAGLETIEIGDAQAVRRIGDAVNDAYLAVMAYAGA